MTSQSSHSAVDNELCVKLVSHDMINRKLQLVVGLNNDTNKFSYTGDCVAGGIYYCKAKDIG